MIYLDILIIFVMIILWFMIKNFIKYIRLLWILFIVSGYLMLILGFITRHIIKNKIMVFGTSRISNIVFKLIINGGLVLLIVGVMLLIIYIMIIIFKHRILVSD